MSKEAYEKEYPEAQVVDFERGDAGLDFTNWSQDNAVVVAEYFYKEDDTIYWLKMSGAEILDGPREYPGDYIPVIAVVGEELHLEERVVRNSVIRFAKDAQRMYNYWRSAQTELIALQPKAPYKMTARQLKGNEAYWNNANTSNLPYLLYNPDDQAPGAPQREQPPVPSSGMTQEIMLAADDMKATTGIYDAGLGNQSNETSGVAIEKRQIEGDISTSIYVDNLAKSIRHCGRIIVGMIPFIYDQRRTIQVMGEDGQEKMQVINDTQMTPMGPVTFYDTGVGEFSVRIKTGPSYSTKREQAVNSIMEFLRAVPQAAPLVGDLVARNMDWPGADELADRLKKMLPPGLIEKEDEEPPSPEEQQAMQAQQQAEQEAMQMAKAKEAADVAKAEAEAAEAMADAESASLEVVEKQMELAIKNGLFDAAIQEGVARALQGLTGPQG